MTTKGDVISRIKNSVKAVNQDAFLTDRLVYSLVLKYAKLYIKREDDKYRMSRYRGIFETIPCVELIEVSTIEACCSDIKTCCTVRRTKDKLPPIIEGSLGFIFGDVRSIDGSRDIKMTYLDTYTRMTNTTNFKYNKTLYCWFKDGYLYFPNIDWDGVSVEGLWEDGIGMYSCDGKKCIYRQDESTAIPDFLFAEIEQNVRTELLTLGQIQKEPAASDNQSKLKN